MRIVTSDVSLASSRICIATSTVKEHLRQWDKNGELEYSAEKSNGKLSSESTQHRDSFQLSQPPPMPLPKPAQAVQSKGSDNIREFMKDEFIGDVKARIMKDIIEAFTGKKIDVFNQDDLAQEQSDNTTADAPAQPAAQTSASQESLGWGIDYQYRETHYTKEGVAFAAAGTVTAADGRTIDFSASLEMSRETYDEINISLKAGDALKDPLVIDLTGAGISFSDVKFAFDIDANGVDEMISAPHTGTGFLAYDRNGNGIIDNGAELFGPQSGNGFAELAQLDGDGNGWIDEGDAAFGSLRILQKEADGTDTVASLLQSNVGAIYTGRATTAYNLAAANGSLAGVLRESGVYLKETGGAGVVQEVDLVV